MFNLFVPHDQVSRTFLQESHQTFEDLHVLAIRLLHPSRQFLHRELQYISVLTVIADSNHPRSIVSSILCIKLLVHLLHQSFKLQEYS